MRGGSVGLSRGQAWGFWALCLLGASGWLVDGAWPSALPAEGRPIVDDLAIALALAAVGWRRLQRSELRAGARVGLAAGSVLLLGVPALLAKIALGGVSEVTVAGLFALAPVAVVVLVANLSGGSREEAGAGELLGPVLAGLAGMLLLLPVETPGSLRDVGFAGVAVLGVIVAAASAVWMHRLLRGVGVVEAATIGSLANAVFYLAEFGVERWMKGGGETWGWRAVGPEAAKALGFDLPQVILLVWLLREVTPQRFAARYLAIPLLTVVEGYAMLRPEIQFREAAGAALAAFGVWRLLTAGRNVERSGLILR